MRKNIIKISVFALLTLPALTACEMDQLSPTNIGPDEATSSMEDAEAWRMGLYSSLRGVYSAGAMYNSDVTLDEFALTTSDANTNQPMSMWTFENATQDAPTSIYANNYSFIKNINKAIEKLPNILNVEGLSRNDSLEVQQILGEAHLMRAMAYQTLTVFFTDRYDAAKAGQENTGLPIIAKVDEDELPVRQTLDSTYNFILADLAAARSMMNNAVQAKLSPSYLHNPEIVNYLLPAEATDIVEARVRLMRNKPASANAEADATVAARLAEGIISAGNYPLATTAEELQNMWLNDTGSEIIAQAYQSKDETGAEWSTFKGLNLNLTGQLGTDAFIPYMYPSNEALELYENSDIRATANFSQGWSYPAYLATGSTQNAFVMLLNKFPGNPALQQSRTDTYNMAKIFRSPEAYLLAAEAEYKLGNDTEALSYFNMLHHDARKASEVTDATDFEQQLANEYVREFMGEGRAFEIYKRLKISFSRGAQQQAGANTRLTITVNPDNRRWTWEFPQQDLNANPNLVGNWNVGK